MTLVSHNPSEVIVNPKGPFVKVSEDNRTEEDSPDAVIDRFQPHVFSFEHVRDIDPSRVPSDASVPADEAEFEMIGISDLWERLGIGPLGRLIDRSRCSLTESFMGTLAVELVAEGSEPSLLGSPVSGWRSGGLGLERAVHSFVSPVLLRTTGLDQFRSYAQADPPDGQTRKPTQGRGREGCSVVGAERVR